MKYILYAGAALMMLLFGGCDKMKVGYLEADKAAYPVARLEIYNLDGKIAELKVTLAAFNEAAAPVRTRYDAANADYKARKTEYDRYVRYNVRPVEDSITFVLDADADADLIGRMKERLEEEIYPERDRLIRLANVAEMALQAMEKEMDDLGAQMGIPSVTDLEDRIEELERRVKFNIPWTTSTIEGVLGTEPLNYEVVGVRNDAHPDAAVAFLSYVTMLGGGRVCVQQEVNVPAGEYVLTIRVWNEGRSCTLQDAFTFIVI